MNKKILIMTAFATLISATASYAAEDSPSMPVYASETDSQTQSQIDILSGGVSDDGMDNITQVEKDYSLKLVFVQQNGEYLADIAVQVTDRRGNIVADTTSKGPILLMKLPEGHYTVTSSVEGITTTHNVHVSGRGLTTYVVRTHIEESDTDSN